MSSDSIDGDILLAMLGGIKQGIEDVESEVNSVYTCISDISETNNKLDKIIELLEKIAKNI